MGSEPQCSGLCHIESVDIGIGWMTGVANADPKCPLHGYLTYPRARVRRSPWGWTFTIRTGPDMDAIHTLLHAGPYSTHDMAMTEAARYVAAYRRKKEQ